MIHQGLTWDHPRGYAALAAAAGQAAAEGRAIVAWSKQPLEGFESHPIADLAARFDLLVLDHPHIGEAVDADCLVPLEELFAADEIASVVGADRRPGDGELRLGRPALCAAARRRDAGDGLQA